MKENRFTIIVVCIAVIFTLSGLSTFAQTLTRIAIDSSVMKDEIAKLTVYSPFLDKNIESDNSEKWQGKKQAGKFVFQGHILRAFKMNQVQFLDKVEYLIEPGDQIEIKKVNNKIEFFGINSTKYNLLYNYWQDLQKFRQTPIYGNIRQQHEAFNLSCDSILNKWLSVVKESRQKLSHFAETYIRACIISSIEHDRFKVFVKLFTNRVKRDSSSVTVKVTEFDKHIAKSPFFDLLNNDSNCIARDYTTALYYAFSLLSARKSAFNPEIYTIESQEKRALDIFDLGSAELKGLPREYLLRFVLTHDLIANFGVTKETKQRLNEYFNLPAYGKYRTWMREHAAKAEQLTTGMEAPMFTLEDEKGNIINLQDFRGKVIVMDFWFTGCAGCVLLAPKLKKVEEKFSDNQDVAFLSISIDNEKNKWLHSVSQGKYTTGKGFNLYTQGKGVTHDVVKDYQIDGYPKLILIGADGILLANPAPDPTIDDGTALTSIISKEVAALNDGPYIFKDGSDYIVKKLYRSNGRDTTETNKINGQTKTISVSTHILGKTFSVPLISKFDNEQTTFPSPEKMFILSDIEGNFDSFYSLLLNNGIIDTSLSWTFNKGHLVLIGDFLDRGNQVIETLWLIHKLEQEAKANGGYVHFILGNHEILNLKGDTKYMHRKYKSTTKLLNIDSSLLWGSKSYLGQWLRTKNIVEKIGDILFVHGGISQQVNSKMYLLNEINTRYRDELRKAEDVSTPGYDDTASILGSMGPLWYRGYYKIQNGKIASHAQVDSTLSEYAVKHIVTGHTIVGDTITTHYDGKIINVDTHHAEGKSEALLILGSKVIRVNTTGNRSFLLNLGDTRVRNSVYTEGKGNSKTD